MEYILYLTNIIRSATQQILYQING